MNWTDENVERLKRLVASGMGDSAIAALFGCTRNTIIGKRMRLGLPSRGRQPAVRLERVPRPSGPPRARKPSPATIGKPATAAQLDQAQEDFGEALEATDLPAEFSAHACTLVELTEDTCRWPLGDPQSPEFRFCGAKPLSSLPYCGPHAAMAYASARSAPPVSEAERLRRRKHFIAINKRRTAA